MGYGYSATSSAPADVIALTDAATINTDAALGATFTVTLGGNRTLANPINPTHGQRIVYRLKQDTSGNRTVTWGSAFRFVNGTPPTLSTAGAKTDYIGFIYNATDSKWDQVAAKTGF